MKAALADERFFIASDGKDSQAGGGVGKRPGERRIGQTVEAERGEDHQPISVFAVWRRT